jgi:C4-dicarboxylate-specific signal transduction histidine kinase
MIVAELPCNLEAIEVAIAELLAQYEEMSVAELPYRLEATEVAVVEPLARYEEMTVAELLVEQEWQVHVSQVTTSVFDLIVYTASVVISAHLRKFHVCSTI